MLPNKGGVCAPSNAPSGTAIEYKVGDILISNIRPYFQKIWQADCNVRVLPMYCVFALTIKQIANIYITY